MSEPKRRSEISLRANFDPLSTGKTLTRLRHEMDAAVRRESYGEKPAFIELPPGIEVPIAFTKGKKRYATVANVQAFLDGKVP